MWRTTDASSSPPPTRRGAKRAIDWIKSLTDEVEVGRIYRGKVVRIMPNLGAFVEVLPNQDGLVHISRLTDYRVERVEEVVNVGDEIISYGSDSVGVSCVSSASLLDHGATAVSISFVEDQLATGPRAVEPPGDDSGAADVTAAMDWGVRMAGALDCWLKA